MQFHFGSLTCPIANSGSPTANPGQSRAAWVGTSTRFSVAFANPPLATSPRRVCWLAIIITLLFFFFFVLSSAGSFSFFKLSRHVLRLMFCDNPGPRSLPVSVRREVHCPRPHHHPRARLLFRLAHEEKKKAEQAASRPRLSKPPKPNSTSTMYTVLGSPKNLRSPRLQIPAGASLLVRTRGPRRSKNKR